MADFYLSMWSNITFATIQVFLKQMFGSVWNLKYYNSEWIFYYNHH